jgi:hypothetical protein
LNIVVFQSEIANRHSKILSHLLPPELNRKSFLSGKRTEVTAVCAAARRSLTEIRELRVSRRSPSHFLAMPAAPYRAAGIFYAMRKDEHGMRT